MYSVHNNQLQDKKGKIFFLLNINKCNRYPNFENSCRNIKREGQILYELRKLESVVKILGSNPFENLPHYIVLRHSGKRFNIFNVYIYY